jgi:hypothetical protein
MRTFNTSIFALIFFLTSAVAASAGGGRGRAVDFDFDFEQQQHQRNLKKRKKHLFSPKAKPPIEDDGLS